MSLTSLSRQWRLDIAVPTYNCVKWIDGLFESIVSQDFADWTIVARDDASTDGTARKLDAWKRRLGDRLFIAPTSGTENLGMVENYSTVLSHTTAPFVMLADPDDIFLPEKIRFSMITMFAAEKSSPVGCPLMVCSDATVVDSELKVIAPSYWQWSGHNVNWLNTFHRLIVESPALTSTMIVNRALLDLALPMTGASCPDWWLALVACAFGKIVAIPQSTLLYRRHSANDSFDPLTSALSVGSILKARTRVDILVRQFSKQADCFLQRFSGRLSTEDEAALRSAAELPHLGPIGRRTAVLKHGLLYASSVKNAGLMLLL